MSEIFSQGQLFTVDAGHDLGEMEGTRIFGNAMLEQAAAILEILHEDMFERPDGQLLAEGQRLARALAGVQSLVEIGAGLNTAAFYAAHRKIFTAEQKGKALD